MGEEFQSPRETVTAFPRSGYDITFVPSPARIRMLFNGVTVADSDEAMILREGRLAPVYYFPRADVRTDLMHPTRRRTHCPFRGNASYWTLKVGEQMAENAVWSYEEPYAEARKVKDYIAFDQARMDAVYERDEPLEPATPAPLSDQTNPLVDWLLRKAWDAASMRELVSQAAKALVQAGIPVSRLWIAIRTLHPQLLSTSYLWESSDGHVQERTVGHDVLQEQRYLDSPLKLIFEGMGGVRRRLDVPDPQLDYPIVRDLLQEGATDYVAMPLVFSDGQINVISLSTKQPGGFRTRDLGHLYEVLPLLSRLLEVHAVRRTALNLLNTYLGGQSGQRVLNGLVKRGDGENIHAVIWFCDLRESTALAESVSREEFLEILNQYFECMAGAVLEHGGEVLRFIGDAVLAIFPIAEPAGEQPEPATATLGACEAALAAVRDAARRMAELGRRRAGDGQPPLGYGVGLHVGHVMYGNIGTPTRLEFSVVGPAANEAARIESLCKTLAVPVLLSSEFAQHYAGELVSLGRHHLRGVSSPREIFTLAVAAPDEAQPNPAG
jgi:adenylate cyclase